MAPLRLFTFLVSATILPSSPPSLASSSDDTSWPNTWYQVRASLIAKDARQLQLTELESRILGLATMVQQAKTTASIAAAEAMSELEIGGLLAEDEAAAHVGLELAQDATSSFACRGCSRAWQQLFAAALEDVVASSDVTFAMGSWSANLWQRTQKDLVSPLEVEGLALRSAFNVVLGQREATYRSIVALKGAFSEEATVEVTARDLMITLRSCLKLVPWMKLKLDPSNDLYLLELQDVIKLYVNLYPIEKEALKKAFNALFQQIASIKLKQYVDKHHEQFPAPGSWPVVKAPKFILCPECTVQ